MDRRWQYVEELFHAAKERPPGERAAFLQSRCEGDEVLRREVSALLAKDAEAEGPVDRPAWDGVGDLLESSPEIALPAGTALGPYRITGVLGAGGMGQVYRAHDARLGRSVAIKVARGRFSERFEREARAVAALNHPNICTVYDVGPNYLVMELVEGPTLADRIGKGRVALPDALHLARQIADALQAAHDAGIVHRDLKPGNIKVKSDGTVKVLDFGLAKVDRPAIASADGSPSVHVAASDVGMILGTAAYMAPEQARGEAVDKRADIWSFGTVLFEMLTGERLFTGGSLSDVLAGVLKEEPDLSRVPPTVRRLLRTCLEKDHRKRLRDIGDAMRLLPDEDLEKPAGARPFGRGAGSWMWPGATAAAAIVAVVALVLHFREKPVAAAASVSFQIVPPGISAYKALALSPDGRKLAFSGIAFDGISRLWVRDFDSLTARSIPEAEGINGAPIWSPDARALAFASGGKLKRIDASGGSPITLCDWPGEGSLLTGAWSGDNVILFSRPSGGLQKVSSSGGACPDVTTSGHHPSMLPDGRHFVYLQTAAETKTPGMYIGSLDASPAEQPTNAILPIASQGNLFTGDFVPSSEPSNGYLVFNQPSGSSAVFGAPVAQPFDPQRMRLSGEPLTIPVSVVGGYGNGATSMMFSLSPNGTIAYSTNGTGRYQNVWYDRTGKVIGTAGDAGDYGDVALSPDDGQVAFHNREGSDDLWLFDFSRRISTRLTLGPNRDHQAVWSPDGRLIIWGVQRATQQALYVKASNGTGEERLVTNGDAGSYNVPDDWSPDGRFLLYAAGSLPSGPATNTGVGRTLWMLPLQPDGMPAGQPQTYLENPLGLGHARFSPNGRWVAYTIGTEGAQNVYVSPFPLPRGREDRWTISNGGGFQPLWREDGKELLYFSSDNKVMSVEVNTTSAAFQSAVPKPLFTARIAGGPPNGPTHRWDVTHDAQRFLINTVLDVTQSPPITIVTNWETALKH